MSLTNENQDVKVPWWFNEESSRMLNGGYLLRGENLDGALERITSAAAKRLKRPDLKEKFKEIVWNGWMSLSSPIWANMGTQRGLPISCMLNDTLIEVKSGDVHLTMTIEELTKRWDEGIRNFQIKVFNTDTKTIEYSKINRVWETKKTKSLVYLSVGEAGTNNIRCTPDHLILMSNGEYKPAEEIKPLDKLQGESYKTVVEVKNVEAEEEVSVFDIEVDHPSHNFYLPEAEVFVHNCFGVNVPDSLNLISDKLKEVTMQTKIGGGTSGYFGNIRERGAKIKDNGESSGPVPFMQIFDTTMGVVSQGSCYEKGTEVLTDKGFKDFREVDPKTDKIAQLDEYNNIDFTDQYELTSKKYTGDLVKIRGRKRDDLVSIAVTTNHRMVIERMKGRKSSGTKRWAGYTEIVTAEDLRLHRDNRLYIAGKTSVTSNKFSDEDRLKIAFQADGRKDSGDTIRFRFVKERKISRLIEILDRLGLTYETKVESKSNVTNIYVKSAGKYKLPDLSWVNLSEVSAEWCEDFIEELVLWDGSHDGKLRYTYCSINRINVDMVQAIASLCGKRTRITVESEREGNRQDLYSISITDNGKIQGDSCEIYREAYDDMVYCCIVPKGRILVRHEDRTLVCGNTRRGAFAAYLDIDHPDFEEFLQIRDIGNPIQNLFTGACIPDYWMQEMVDGDMEKRRIWAKVLESRQQKGMPYLFFTDNVNKNKPQVYKDKKMQITHSNLCFTGDNKVFTNIAGENKEISFESLYSKFGKGEGLEDLKVWCKDDGEIKQVGVKEVMLVGYASELTRLTFDGEYIVECTPDHRFLLDSGDYKEAQYLTPEDKLASSGAYGLNEVEAVSIKGNQLIQLQEKVPVYCLEVLNDSHNFLLSIDNQGVIVSNCSEISTPDGPDESFVCCLSSLNLELYDEWKNTDTVKLAIYFLDAVMSEFIENSADIPGLKAVNKFARRHRSLGLGVMGYASYLQKNNIPFESMEAKTFNAKVFKEIESKARKASKELAKVYGEPELLKGYGLRNTTLMAIAP